DLVIADRDAALGRCERRVFQRLGLLLAPGSERLRRGGVMTVTVDDHWDISSARRRQGLSVSGSENFPAVRASASPAWRTAAAAAMVPPMPVASIIAALARISSARRLPCWRTRENR